MTDEQEQSQGAAPGDSTEGHRERGQEAFQEARDSLEQALEEARKGLQEFAAGARDEIEALEQRARVELEDLRRRMAGFLDPDAARPVDQAEPPAEGE